MFDHWRQRFSFKEEDVEGFPSLKVSYKKNDRPDRQASGLQSVIQLTILWSL